MIFGRKAIGTVAYMGGTPATLEAFTWSWGQMIAYNAEHLCQPNEYVHLDRARFSFHSWARNSLVERMLGDWLFMLDTDHEFEPDILARLLHRLNTYDLEVVSGLYQLRTPPHAPVLYGWHDTGDGECTVPLTGWDGELIEIGAAGAGCLLVRKRVFDRIRDELQEGAFSVSGQSGEDIAFFHRLRRLGITPFCDTRVECPHLLTRGLTMADYDETAITAEPIELTDKVAIQL
jgi:Glycosyl transferase family 2